MAHDRIKIYYRPRFIDARMWRYGTIDLGMQEQTPEQCLAVFRENWPQDEIVCHETYEDGDPDFPRFLDQDQVEKAITRIRWPKGRPALPCEAHQDKPISAEVAWKAVEDLCTSYR